VRFIERDADRWTRRALAASAVSALSALAALIGCATRSPTPGTTAPPAPPTPLPPAIQPAPAPSAVTGYRARHWDEYRELAAKKVITLNPGGTYLGRPPEPLLAIPVLEIELQADGSIARISVQRQPSQARDTVQIAIDAVRRAAPFGPVSHLPRPWKFSEVFLFDDDRKFKPRSLD
jgi:hypothetical protein